MKLPKAKFGFNPNSLAQYRFGFQGMRKGNQLYGDGNLYETPFRNYDPFLGRWRSPDPIQHPWQGSYTAFNNNPIYFVDPMGLEGDENDEPEDGATRTTEKDGRYKYDADKGKWVAQGFKEQQLRTVNIVEEDPNKPISGVEARMDFMRFKMRMESPLERANLKSNSEIDRAVRQAGLSQSQLSAEITREEVIRDLNFAANWTSWGLNKSGKYITYSGLVVSAFPRGQAYGVPAIGVGNSLSTAGTVIDLKQSGFKQNWTKFGTHATDLALSATTGKIIETDYARGLIKYHDKEMIKGGSSIIQGQAKDGANHLLNKEDDSK